MPKVKKTKVLGEQILVKPDILDKKSPKTEEFYSWFEFKIVDGEKEPRLLIPHSDPYQYDFPIDFMYDSIEHAMKGLNDWEIEVEAIENNWVLCKIIKQPIKTLNKE